MIASRIRKAGNSYVVTIPPREMAARGLRAGQLVGFEPVPLELRPAAPPSPTRSARGRCSFGRFEHPVWGDRQAPEPDARRVPHGVPDRAQCAFDDRVRSQDAEI